MESLPGDIMKDYISGLTKKRARTLKILSQDHKHLTAFFETELGQELFGWLQGKHEELLSRIASLKVTDEEKVAYSLVHEWLLHWGERYNQYMRVLKGIEKEMTHE